LLLEVVAAEPEVMAVILRAEAVEEAQLNKRNVF
jgi:hypothetical protein